MSHFETDNHEGAHERRESVLNFQVGFHCILVGGWCDLTFIAYF